MFYCPLCSEPNLVIREGVWLDVPKELQVLTCKCTFVAVALFEESPRFAPEGWRHRGYREERKVIATLFVAMMSCKVRRRECDCLLHRNLAREGYRRYLNGVSFPLERHQDPHAYLKTKTPLKSR